MDSSRKGSDPAFTFRQNSRRFATSRSDCSATLESRVPTSLVSPRPRWSGPQVEGRRVPDFSGASRKAMPRPRPDSYGWLSCNNCPDAATAHPSAGRRVARWQGRSWGPEFSGWETLTVSPWSNVMPLADTFSCSAKFRCLWRQAVVHGHHASDMAEPPECHCAQGLILTRRRPRGIGFCSACAFWTRAWLKPTSLGFQAPKGRHGPKDGF